MTFSMILNKGSAQCRRRNSNRVLAAMSQKRLSVVTGVSVQNISAMENGRRAIGKDVAKRFAEALHVDWRVFLR